MNKFILLLCFTTYLFSSLQVFSNDPCDFYFEKALSIRVANYQIDVDFDHVEKTINATQNLVWINPSPDTIHELRFYMYMNAFKNTGSSFIKGSENSIFGQDLRQRPAHEWGWIEVTRIVRDDGTVISGNTEYIQPDDGNPQDQTVLSVRLNNPVYPFDTLELEMNFIAKLPKTIVRAGYSRDDFHLWVHWFPQIGVYEQDISGEWGWNCHQFFMMTEFYADFGAYDVNLTLDEKFVVGATGCKTNEITNSDGTVTYSYHAEDVIDFAWTAYPYFEEITDQWEHVCIRLLIPPEHAYLSGRFVTAIKKSLTFLNEHVGIYPFPVITIMDPPLHGLMSGMMEYPTFITGGTFYGIPKKIRWLEALAMHEFSHQYFMMMLASNEKEEAWLDEGFVTYFEDRMLDHYYGPKSSYIDLMGIQMGNVELSRLEYTGMKNHRVGITAKPGWKITEAHKSLVYSKPATMLKSLEKMVGVEIMDTIMKTYFETWKFRHPRGIDFISIVDQIVKKELGDQRASEILSFIEQCLYTASVCDYSVAGIENQKQRTGTGLFGVPKESLQFRTSEMLDVYFCRTRLYREGDMIVPVEVAFSFEDGSVQTKSWDGSDLVKVYEFSSPSKLISVHIDPEQKILMDIDLNNNSLTVQPNKWGLGKISLRAITWVQNSLQTLSILM